jgi:predicted molibdopterin-dependent oxidoreductase YjgC
VIRLTDQEEKPRGNSKKHRESKNAHLNIRIDQNENSVPTGISVASALILNGIKMFRRTDDREARGYYCGMGVCYECLVTIDGQPDQRACMTMVKDGMQIITELDRS